MCIGALVLPQFLAGCSGGNSGPKTVPVSGTITYGGKPVASGEISFAPVDAKGRSAAAAIGKDGSFTAKLSESSPGLVPGDYKIFITSYKKRLDQIPPAELKSLGDSNLAVPKKYTELATTTLTVSISDKDRSKRLDLKLDD